MTRLVVSQFVSVDGVIEDPVGIEDLGRGSWTSVAGSGSEGEAFKLAEMLDSAAMLLGRATYAGYAAAWPGRDGQYADKINSMPKYVVSTTIDEPEWHNTAVISDEVPTAIARLKEEIGGEILVHGSAQLTRTLMEHDLVDEWRLMVFPIVVGTGTRCFGDPGQVTALRLTGSRAVGDGIAILTYEPAREQAREERA